MFDVRFLPNPHYEPDLRPLTGNDPRVVEFINRGGALDEFYEQLDPLLDYLLPQYLAEGKSHLVVAVGCTGGRHRSVAIAEHLAERYRGDGGYLVDVVHRDEGEAGVIDHIGFEVSDLGRTAAFYDAGLLRARGAADARLRARGRLRHQRAGGVVRRCAGSELGRDTATWRCTPAARRGRRRDTRRGSPTGALTTRSPPGLRPQYGSRYYAAYLPTPTASGSSWSHADAAARWPPAAVG